MSKADKSFIKYTRDSFVPITRSRRPLNCWGVDILSDRKYKIFVDALKLIYQEKNFSSLYLEYKPIIYLLKNRVSVGKTPHFNLLIKFRDLVKRDLFQLEI